MATSSSNEPAAAARKPETSRRALIPFAVISCCYLLFTVTDGAIRMIVLQHAYTKGFSALQVAIMFTLYELAGVFTNLAAGLAGSRWGIRCTLVTGLSLQLVSYGMLFAWRDEWSQLVAIIYVTVAQMFGGIAKDLTKLGGKTVTKLVTPAEQSTRLFRLVAALTGWKNSLKGVGYFIGSSLVAVSYELALGFMMGLIVIALPIGALGLGDQLGRARKTNAKWSDIFITHNPNLNWLSLARCFLFASRDFWFEVPLPFFLRAPSCEGLGVLQCEADSDCGSGAYCAPSMEAMDAGYATGANTSHVCANINAGGGCGGLGWDRVVVGAILGGYIIVYGQVQSWTPQLVTRPLRQDPPNKLTEVLWGVINTVPTAVMAAVAWLYSDLARGGGGPFTAELSAWVLTCLVLFAFVFAINSSIHSFLVVHYAKADKVATSVGFYYMSNAVGRLLGTLGSGVLYTYAGSQNSDRGSLMGSDALRGLAACFIGGTVSSLLAALITLKISDEQAGLQCGPLVCVAASPSGKVSATKAEVIDVSVSHATAAAVKGAA